MRLTNYENLFDKIISEYEQSQNQRFLVSIAGCSRVGKTTLAKKLKVDFKRRGINSKIISLDNWLLGLDERDGTETIRERYQYNQICEDIKKIKKGQKIHTRTYDPKTRKIIKNDVTNSFNLKYGEIGIIDGIVSLDIKELRNISDFKIYVDIDDDARKSRLIDFYVNYKGYTLEETKNIIEPRESEEVRKIRRTKKYADCEYSSVIRAVASI
jgi:uridine kinase